MRRLFPEPTEGIAPLDAYADLPPAEGRPAVRLNMIASVDGASAVEGLWENSPIQANDLTEARWRR